MVVYEFTKDCGYETRTARIYITHGYVSVSIETAIDIYERDMDTYEEAIELVTIHGFDKANGSVEMI